MLFGISLVCFRKYIKSHYAYIGDPDSEPGAAPGIILPDAYGRYCQRNILNYLFAFRELKKNMYIERENKLLLIITGDIDYYYFNNGKKVLIITGDIDYYHFNNGKKVCY